MKRLREMMTWIRSAAANRRRCRYWALRDDVHAADVRGLCVLVLAAVLGGGCQNLQMPTISQQQIDAITNFAAQAQIVYAQIEPLIPVIQEAAQQLMKDEAIGGCDGGEARGDRSSQWRTVRDRYANTHPLCAFCGSTAVDVHHIQPFHLFPARELDPDNLVSLCRNHHFIYGHAGDWKAYNPDVMIDSEFWRALKLTRQLQGKGAER